MQKPSFQSPGMASKLAPWKARELSCLLESIFVHWRKTIRLPALLKTLTAGLIALSAVSAFADQLADIKKKGEIVFGVLGTDEPNSFVDANTREFIGYEVDLARAIAAKMGVKPVFKQLVWPRHQPEV
jgi:polar amino acid transport system substrate-binding protein